MIQLTRPEACCCDGGPIKARIQAVWGTEESCKIDCAITVLAVVPCRLLGGNLGNALHPSLKPSVCVCVCLCFVTEERKKEVGGETVCVWEERAPTSYRERVGGSE